MGAQGMATNPPPHVFETLTITCKQVTTVMQRDALEKLKDSSLRVDSTVQQKCFSSPALSIRMQLVSDTGMQHHYNKSSNDRV